MAISEATALARAAQVKASFPKGPITIKQAQAMVLSMADSQVGYASGSSTRSLYGRRKNWPKGSWSTNQEQAQNYWCYRGLSWVFTMCFGRDATIAGIGNQGHFPFPGWAATWLGMAWMRARGMGVSVSNARPGDLSFQSWGRTNNPTDHIEIITGTWSGSYLPHIGFNTSSGSGSVTTGATVARVWRPGWPIKFIGRPNWAAIVATYNATVVAEEVIDWTSIHRMLLDLGYPANESGVRSFQSDKADWGHNLTVDGVPGPATERALGDAMSRIDDIENKIDSLPQNVWGYRHPTYDSNRDAHGMLRDTRNGVRSTEGRVSDIVRSLKALPTAIIAARVPFKEGTSLHRLFGKDFRFGALLGYAGASMVDRDTHTDEIVDALDADEVGPGTVHSDGAASVAVEEQT